MTHRPQDEPIASSGRLRYYAASNVVVAVESPFARVKLFRLNFGADGSIYVSFPYLTEKRGVISDVKFGDSPTIDLAKAGIVVETDAKFAHHTSGVVHFSQTGKIDRGPQRRSFRLDGPIGRIFQLNAYWLLGFKWLDQPKRKDFTLVRQFGDKHPFGVVVEATWLRKADIIANTFHVPGTTGDHIGPRTESIHTPTGTVSEVVFLGPPASSPLQDHVVMLSITQTIVPEGADIPMMLFLGGFDIDEVRPTDAPAFATGGLAFMYPYEGAPIVANS